MTGGILAHQAMFEDVGHTSKGANEVGPVFPGFDMFTQVFQAGGSRALQATGFGSGMTLLQCLAEGVALDLYDSHLECQCHELKVLHML